MTQLTRRKFLGMATALGVGAAGFAVSPRFAFAQDATPPALPPAPAAGPIDLTAAGGMDKLVAAATKEGELSTIALPDDWANYKEVKSSFLSKYPGIKLNDLNPDGSSSDEVQAIVNNAGNKGPQNPDVIDVGFVWGKKAKDQGLLQPYKVATWDTIPDELKDPEGYWYADYYGVMAIEVNADAVENVPQDFADLLKPEYQGLVALSGDPSAAAQPAYAVWAAALANGGSLDDATAGLEYFKQLADAGSLSGTIYSFTKLVSGEMPITLRWDYNALADRDKALADKSANIQVIYPKSGSIAGVYVQAISAYSPRPNAARLWMEYLYSDEGQNLWLKGYATPARFADLKKRNAIPESTLKNLPTTDVTVAFPNMDQINNTLKAINDNWNQVVGVTLAQ